jgi:PAS domain S-box-containing protein
MAAKVQMQLLGGLRLSGPQGIERKLPTRKARALAAYLAMHPGRRLDRPRLAALLWPEEDGGAARHSLRQALVSIREALGRAAVVGDDEWISCGAGAVTVDAIEFEHLAQAQTFAASEQAEQLYRGDFLDGFETGQPAYDEWLMLERERLRELARRNLGRLLLQRIVAPELDAALATARQMIRFDPFDEAAHRSLMRLYVRQGRRPQAVRHFHGLSRLLRQELGVGPDQESVALYEEICCAPPAAAPASLDRSIFVLEQLPYCVVVTDLANRIVGWNKIAEQKLGFTKDDLSGRSPTLLYAPARDQRLADQIFKLALANGKWSQRVKLLSKDGRVHHQIRTVTPLHDRGGQLIGAFGVGTPCGV